ncbi:apolipoprotein N-acyltransferase [Aurantivibrio plasticivorans]
MRLQLPKPSLLWLGINLLAGALIPLCFAPFNFWPAGILSTAILATSLYNSQGKLAFRRSLAFGLGMFGVGTSWVFVSIHEFGNAPLPFAGLLTALFTLLLASVFAIPFGLRGRWLNSSNWMFALSFPATWLLSEWLRTWLFTGFPWLFLGYGHIHTWLSGWAPVFGVLGLGYIVALTGTTVSFAARHPRQPRQWAAIALLTAAFWALGLVLKQVSWTQDYQTPKTVGIAQGNIPQDKKWDTDFVEPTLQRYGQLSESLWENDWVIWPEAAIPLILNYRPHSEALEPALQNIKSRALATNTTFITGILYLSPVDRKFYNSVVATGLGNGIYHKQRLAPFGDYVPLSDWLGPLLELFNLPHSILVLGPPNQRGLQAGGALLSPAICYEVAYPDLVAQGARNSHVLITVSNDAWFGSSLGPIQHMQIAQMRAIENQRYMIRSTNNGISGIIDHKGNILARSEQFVAQAIESEVVLKSGTTPFMAWGSTPSVLFSFLLIAIHGIFLRVNRGRKPSIKQ